MRAAVAERRPEADPALRDEEIEREVARAIEATQALRASGGYLSPAVRFKQGPR